jgi:ribonucleoside-diphosphate reductase beta chain
VECADSISKYYDTLIEMIKWYELFGEGEHNVTSEEQGDPVDGQVLSVSRKYHTKKIDLYELKKQLYLCMASVNILEGVRFYVSFACSWAFAELKKMEGNAKIIKLIARDENLHLASTQMMLKLLRKEDPDFEQIAMETEEECTQMFVDAVDQEKEWAEYLFKDGSMIGLNTELLSQYIEWICTRRMTNVKLKSPYNIKNNPLPWTQKWISGADVQVAPQETEITSYVQGGTKQDVSNDTFKGFSL